MESPQVVGDPHCEIVPYNGEITCTVEEDTSFLISVEATFTRVPTFSDDDDDDDLIYDAEEESVVISQSLRLPLETVLINGHDHDTEAKAAIQALFADLHVPFCLSYLTNDIVSCGRDLWNGRNNSLSYGDLGVNVIIHVFVDQLPVDHEDQTAMIRFEAATKESIGGLERVRIEDEGSDHMVVSCLVCLEDVLVGSEAIKLPCSHLYHKDCIVEWLQSSKFCPLCRFEIA